MVVFFWCKKIDKCNYWIFNFPCFHFLNRNYFLIMSLYKSSSFCLFSISGNLIKNKQMLLVYIKKICHFYGGRNKTAIAMLQVTNKQRVKTTFRALTKKPLYTCRWKKMCNLIFRVAPEITYKINAYNPRTCRRRVICCLVSCYLKCELVCLEWLKLSFSILKNRLYWVFGWLSNLYSNRQLYFKKPA